MILALIVLCSFSVSLVNLKLNNLNPFQKWWVTYSEYAAGFLASNYYYSNEGKTLTKAMPLLAACLKRSASCLRAAILVNFCQEIFLAQCEFLTVEPQLQGQTAVKAGVQQLLTQPLGILSFTLEQPLGSSTLATKGALVAQRIFLPVFV